MNIHLFIAGTGGVGKALIMQIRKKYGDFYQKHGIEIIVNGIINSRMMRLSRSGIPLEEPLEEGPEWKEADLPYFISFAKRHQISSPIFVDLTASDNVAATYIDLLQKGVHVVACNKIACSAPMTHYIRLKEASKESGATFLYNTNVGAALPYLQSIRQLHLAGERIDRIEAILSGTLSYIFGQYDGTLPFSQIVKDAHRLGYTEPDPRVDLKGTDVMRKLLIVCREMGIPLEERAIVQKSFLPDSCREGTLDDFYHTLLCSEEFFKERYLEAQAQGGKLKYLATWQNGVASIGLQCVLPDHPTFNLSPKDNILLVYSENYLSPLSISGAGAGAQGTAMGVLADIISIFL